MTKILNLSLLALLLLHLVLAANFELSHDEAYYWLYSTNMDWGFFDHPPMVGLIIRLFSFMPHSELSIRMGFILMQIATCFILMNLVQRPHRWVVVLLFFSFPLASFSGLFALPDMPLLFMTALYCASLKRFLEKPGNQASIILGLVISLLLYSKYHGILAVFFTIIALPRLFKRKDFYLVAIVALVTFIPHLMWQFEHDFSTLRYHFFERPKVDFNLKRLFEYTFAQVFLAGLFVGPVVWWSIIKDKHSDDFNRAMKFISIGTVLFFFASTFSKKFEANWTIFLAAPLVLLSASSVIWQKKYVRVLMMLSLSIVISARFLLVMDPSVIKIKRLKEFHGWKVWSAFVQSQCPNPILANTYQMASKLSFYLGQPVHSLNFHSRKNQFDYWEPNRSYYQSSKVCYLSDNLPLGGTNLQTPEGRTYTIVPNFSPGELPNDNP